MALNVVDTFKFDPTDKTDNASQFVALQASLKDKVANKKPLPRVVFPEGIYKYTGAPNLAVPNLEIEGDGYVELHYTGTGDALTFDGGVGVMNMRVDNLHVVPTDAAKDSLVLKGIHHSYFRVRCHGAGAPRNGVRNNAASLLFCVCTRLEDYSCTTFDYINSISGGGSVINGGKNYDCTGLFLGDELALGGMQATTKCEFVNPVIELCTTGMYFKNAAGNTILDGTIEYCNIAIQLEEGAHNRSFGLWMEGNAAYDVWFGSKTSDNKLSIVPGGLKVKNDANFWSGNSAG
jgi:hypothetical protein